MSQLPFTRSQIRALKKKARMALGKRDVENLDIDRHSTPLVGWRHWRLIDVGDGPRLASIIAGHVYEGPVAYAKDLPTESGHGFYAMKKGYDFYEKPSPGRVVFGSVEMFGQVVEHERGFRGEKLRFKSLKLRPGNWMDPPEDLISGGPQMVHQKAFRSDAPPPWPWPYEEIVEELSEVYRCDVEYEPRPNGPQVMRGCSKFPVVSDLDPNLQPRPSPIHKPTFEEILKYGGHPWISENPYGSTKSSLRREMSSLKQSLKELRQLLKKEGLARQFQQGQTQLAKRQQTLAQALASQAALGQAARSKHVQQGQVMYVHKPPPPPKGAGLLGALSDIMP